jgi:hypothetical protein
MRPKKPDVVQVPHGRLAAAPLNRRELRLVLAQVQVRTKTTLVAQTTRLPQHIVRNRVRTMRRKMRPQAPAKRSVMRIMQRNTRTQRITHVSRIL